MHLMINVFKYTIFILENMPFEGFFERNDAI